MRSLCALALAAAFVAVAPLAVAAEPAGDYVIAVAQPQIFVPVASEPDSCATNLGVSLCVDELPGLVIPNTSIIFPVTNGSGGVASTMVGHVEGDLTGAVFNGDMVGTLSGPAQRRRARVRAQMDGLLTFGGVTLQGVSAGKLRCSPDDENLFVCAGKMRLCATESRRVIGCVVEPMELAFEQQGGAWELQLNDLETEDGVVTGTATVELDGGTTFDYAVAGKYDANRDVSNLILAGQGTAARSKLKLTSVVLDAGAATSGKLVFRIVNQTGKVELGAP